MKQTSPIRRINSIQQVMEAVQRFSDPLSAAKHMVQESFRTWLRYEIRTDDITVIVLFIENFKEGQGQLVSCLLRALQHDGLHLIK